MKRIIIIAAALFTLAGVAVATATASSASVCQPNGTGCTKAGSYPGPNAVINGDYTGFKVVWTRSVVQPYSSGVPLYWTAYMTYTNVQSSSATLVCSPAWQHPSYVSEHMSGGSGNDGVVSAESTTCSKDPSLAVTVRPGGTYTSFATFHNVPWPGSTGAITWGDAGTSSYVNPFRSSQQACVFDAPSGVIPGGLIGHVGWGFQLPNGNWEFGANEGPVNLLTNRTSKTWSKTGSWDTMLATFTQGGPYDSTGYYTSYICVTVPAFNASAAQKEVRHEQHEQYSVPSRDCESQAYYVLLKYGVKKLPSDTSLSYELSPNNWFNHLSSAGFSGKTPL
jgi:hypothetical protein